MKKLKIGLITEIAELSAHQDLAQEYETISEHEVFLNQVENVDLIWVWSNWMFQGERSNAQKVVMSVHHIDTLKINIADFVKMRESYIDAWHVPCTKTRNQLEGYATKPIYQVPYWVNDKTYFPISNKEGLKKKYKIPEDKILVGSFQRDTEGSDLISPKLSKGPDIFADIVIELSKTFPVFVVLTSWRRQYLINRLAEGKIPFVYFELVNQETVNELYNILDWYFVTSRFEGGPLSVLQCAQTKTKILSTAVGIAPEILDKECICNSKDDFILKFKNGVDKTEKNFEIIRNYNAKLIVSKYDLLFNVLNEYNVK